MVGSLLSLYCPVFLFGVHAMSFCHDIVQQGGPCQIQLLDRELSSLQYQEQNTHLLFVGPVCGIVL